MFHARAPEQLVQLRERALRAPSLRCWKTCGGGCHLGVPPSAGGGVEFGLVRHARLGWTPGFPGPARPKWYFSGGRGVA